MPQEPSEDGVLCPFCEGHLYPLSGGDDVCCDACGRHLGGEMVRAYKAGEIAFVEGHRNIATIEARRVEQRNDPLVSETRRYYQAAYTQLRRALALRPPEVFRASSVQMMSEMTRFMALHGMLSRVEAEYWGRLFIEMDVDNGLRLVDREADQGNLGLLKRLLVWRRRRKLMRLLRHMDVEIAELEGLIAFVDPPHARRRSTYLD